MHHEYQLAVLLYRGSAPIPVLTGAGAGDSATTSVLLALVSAVLAVALVAVVAWCIWTRYLVSVSSAALHELSELNGKAKLHLATPPAIKHAYRVRVESKSKYDRFDLARFLRDSILDHEAWWEAQVEAGERALTLFAGYRVSADRLAQMHLGSSSHPRVRADHYLRVETKMFDARRLREPRPSARVTATVSYTSPQGRNSYSRGLEWGFGALQNGLRDAQALRARQSSAQALRERERSLMSDRKRMDILRRDGYRCQMCGATQGDGARLHVDHILPVSRGGRTVDENLQVLCAPCNLGKGNRFVG